TRPSRATGHHNYPIPIVNRRPHSSTLFPYTTLFRSQSRQLLHALQPTGRARSLQGTCCESLPPEIASPGKATRRIRSSQFPLLCSQLAVVCTTTQPEIQAGGFPGPACLSSAHYCVRLKYVIANL